MGSARVIKADGTEELLDHRPSLEEAQKIVGGYIEFAYCPSGLTLVVDEEGRLKNKPANPRATAIYQRSLIVGDVILLEGWKTVG